MTVFLIFGRSHCVYLCELQCNEAASRPAADWMNDSHKSNEHVFVIFGKCLVWLLLRSRNKPYFNKKDGGKQSILSNANVNRVSVPCGPSFKHVVPPALLCILLFIRL